jgi:hypothetical protein
MLLWLRNKPSESFNKKDSIRIRTGFVLKKRLYGNQINKPSFFLKKTRILQAKDVYLVTSTVYTTIMKDVNWKPLATGILAMLSYIQVYKRMSKHWKENEDIPTGKTSRCSCNYMERSKDMI